MVILGHLVDRIPPKPRHSPAPSFHRGPIRRTGYLARPAGLLPAVYTARGGTRLPAHVPQVLTHRTRSPNTTVRVFAAATAGIVPRSLPRQYHHGRPAVHRRHRHGPGCATRIQRPPLVVESVLHHLLPPTLLLLLVEPAPREEVYGDRDQSRARNRRAQPDAHGDARAEAAGLLRRVARGSRLALTGRAAAAAWWWSRVRECGREGRGPCCLGICRAA